MNCVTEIRYRFSSRACACVCVPGRNQSQSFFILHRRPSLGRELHSITSADDQHGCKDEARHVPRLKSLSRQPSPLNRLSIFGAWGRVMRMKRGKSVCSDSLRHEAFQLQIPVTQENKIRKGFKIYEVKCGVFF